MKTAIPLLKTLTMAAILLVSVMACGNREPVNEIITLNRIMAIDGGLDIEHYFTPANIVIDSEGRIFIFDPICMKIAAYNRNGEYLFEFGGPGEAPGEFSFLFYNCDIDADNNIYTINRPCWIEVFASDGTYLKRITPRAELVFDIAVFDSSRIYINAGAMIGSRNYHCIMEIDGDGNTVNEFGSVDVDLENIPLWQKSSVMSCVIDVDEDGYVYYTSIMDYKIFKYDSTGVLVYSVEGETPFEASWEPKPPYGMRTVTPVVWDLCVDQNRIYVLWAQEGGESNRASTESVPGVSTERGYRVDVFNKNSGELLGYFYSQVPSETRNMFIKVVDGTYFYTASHDDGIVYKFEMIY
ncbi:MAG: hypothetical protein KAS73_11545 [Candidatus Sabulitectum sp.]|nr:hypothetical protein [Candidatus Sabulitectum sp.]